MRAKETMKRKGQVRFGISGCGGIANGFHMRDLSQIPEARLVACADIRPQVAKKFAAKPAVNNTRIPVLCNGQTEYEYVWKGCEG